MSRFPRGVMRPALATARTSAKDVGEGVRQGQGLSVAGAGESLQDVSERPNAFWISEHEIAVFSEEAREVGRDDICGDGLGQVCASIRDCVGYGEEDRRRIGGA